MRVMVMVKASRGSEAGEMPSEALLAAMGAYNEELAKAGIMQAGEGLHPSSKGKRVRFSGASRTVMDGPFTETKELVAGFWIWKVASMEEAVAWVKRCPNPMSEDSEIEIRPIFEAEDFGEAFTPELREQEASLRAQTLGLGAVRFERKGPLLLAGVRGRYTMATRSGIPAQWDQFVPYLGKVPHQKGVDTYGVSYGSDGRGGFDYLAAVEVSKAEGLPAGFVHLALPERRYAVFTHAGHVSEIPAAIDALWTKWAPASGLAIAKDACLERYGEAFCGETGRGGMEFWIPLEA